MIEHICPAQPPLGEWSGSTVMVRFVRLIQRRVRALGLRPAPPSAAAGACPDCFAQWYGGLEVAEVARIVGKRPSAVRVLTHRGLRRLARRVEAARLA